MVESEIFATGTSYGCGYSFFFKRMHRKQRFLPQAAMSSYLSLQRKQGNDGKHEVLFNRIGARTAACQLERSVLAGGRHGCRRCGTVNEAPCSTQAPCDSCGGTASAPCEAAAPAEPVMVEKTIMVPTTETETKTIQVTEYTTETREKKVTVTQRVPKTRDGHPQLHRDGAENGNQDGYLQRLQAGRHRRSPGIHGEHAAHRNA